MFRYDNSVCTSPRPFAGKSFINTTQLGEDEKHYNYICQHSTKMVPLFNVHQRLQVLQQDTGLGYES